MENKKIPALVFSRVSGYYTPVKLGDKNHSWNPGKSSEYDERKMLDPKSFDK